MVIKYPGLMSKTKKELTKEVLPPGSYRIVKGMPDYCKDPYFVKKNEAAREFIKKHGLPEDLRKSN